MSETSHELAVIGTCVELLTTLDRQAERRRVAAYLNGRYTDGFASPDAAKPMTRDPFTGRFMQPWPSVPGESDSDD